MSRNLLCLVFQMGESWSAMEGECNAVVTSLAHVQYCPGEDRIAIDLKTSERGNEMCFMMA